MKVLEVRAYIKSIQWLEDVKVIERISNVGLAENIIDGVTQVVNEYGRVIVLEDDLVTSPYFLNFMNDSLEFYKYEKKVWHISGWNYPIDPEGLPETFFWRVMNCWGWATWSDRWQHFERNPEKLISEFSKEEIMLFNLNGSHDFWRQVRGNVEGRLKTWAVFWYATIFKNHGLCLNPTQTMVNNIGHDGSGSNCSKSKVHLNNINDTHVVKEFNKKLSENILAHQRIKEYLHSIKPSIFRRVIGKAKRTLLG